MRVSLGGCARLRVRDPLDCARSIPELSRMPPPTWSFHECRQAPSAGAPDQWSHQGRPVFVLLEHHFGAALSTSKYTLSSVYLATTLQSNRKSVLRQAFPTTVRN